MTQPKLISLNREQSREVDRLATEKYAMPSIILMENAGRGTAEYLLSQKLKDPVIICCGKGNNGGDGFVIARHLDIHQIPVQVLLFAKPQELTPDAKINHEIVVRAGIPVINFLEQDLNDLQKLISSANWTIDALFGTGLQGAVRAPYDKIITSINSHAKNILAVDIPSGLDCDEGTPLGVAIKATCTATFVAMKKGFLTQKAQEYLGKVTIIDIGIPSSLLETYF